MKCKKHPKYKGIRQPTAKCNQCWAIFGKKSCKHERCATDPMGADWCQTCGLVIF
jgi:hypothetical protein